MYRPRPMFTVVKIENSSPTYYIDAVSNMNDNRVSNTFTTSMYITNIFNEKLCNIAKYGVRRQFIDFDTSSEVYFGLMKDYILQLAWYEVTGEVWGLNHELPEEGLRRYNDYFGEEVSEERLDEFAVLQEDILKREFNLTWDDLKPPQTSRVLRRVYE